MDDTIVTETQRPVVDELIQEFKRCSPSSRQWNQLEDSESVRFARWSGQGDDFKKHDNADQKAFPWDGASDQPIYFADSVIGEHVAVCTAAFWRSVLRAQAVEITDIEKAANATKLLEYFVRNKLFRQFAKEVELSAQYMETYGFAALHPTWEREIGLRLIEVTAEEITQFEPPREDDSGPVLIELIMNPLEEEAATDRIEAVYKDYVGTLSDALRIDEIPSIRRKTARALVRDIRETGTGKLPVPHINKNQPAIVALKPWEEFFVSRNQTDVQRARVFVRYLMSEEELRQKILTDEWSEEWVEQAVKLKGHFSVWSRELTAGDWLYAEQLDEESELIEVVYAYTRRLDDNGVAGIYCTVFHPNITKDDQDRDLVAKHGLLDYAHGMMPFVVGQRESWTRNITASRGIPEIAAGWQREIKVHRDALIDWTSIGVLPPILRPPHSANLDLRFGPAAQNTTRPGLEPKFMEVPRTGTPLALQLIEVVEREADNYFGRLSETVPAPRIQVRQQQMVQNFLNMWSEAFAQMFQLTIQYLPAQDWQRITGSEPPVDTSPAEIAGQYDLMLTFDVRELDKDYMLAKLEAVSKSVLPEDVAGVLDRAKLVKFKLQAIDPTYARELVSDQAEASQRLWDDVKDDIAQMFLGNPPEPVENDPTARTKLQYMTRIIGANDYYREALQQGGRFAQLIEVYAKNLQFSITQERNKQIGRIGVDPQAI